MNKKSMEIKKSFTKNGETDWKAIDKEYIVVRSEDNNTFNLIARSRIEPIESAENDETEDEDSRAEVRKIIEEQGYGNF